MEIIPLKEVGIEATTETAAKVLSGGGVVLYPTDTLYGLAVDATNVDALEALRTLKGREPSKPISILVPDIQTMEQYGVMNEEAKQLAKEYLPGALTLVLPATPATPPMLAEDGTIGIRIPDDSFCLALAKGFGRPFTATSANRSGMKTCATIDTILAQFGRDAERITLAIDDGSREGGTGSTIVSVASDTPRVIRQGALVIA